jgi:hypothetical protein
VPATEGGETTETEYSPLQQLKMDSGRVGLDNAFEAISKLGQLRFKSVLENVPPKPRKEVRSMEGSHLTYIFFLNLSKTDCSHC